MMHIAKLALGVALFASHLGSGAARAATPAGGTVHLFATPSMTNNGTGTIVIIGAIGDFGTFVSTNKNGTVNPNGDYVKMTLKKGTLEVDSTTLNAAANKLQPTFYPATCSAYLTVSDPVRLFNGTGLYKGIAGTVKITETFAAILPRYTSGAKKGQCNGSSNAQPVAQYGSITGSGTVSFS
jgi:hypothetical protein